MPFGRWIPWGLYLDDSLLLSHLFGTTVVPICSVTQACTVVFILELFSQSNFFIMLREIPLVNETMVNVTGFPCKSVNFSGSVVTKSSFQICFKTFVTV